MIETVECIILFKRPEKYYVDFTREILLWEMNVRISDSRLFWGADLVMEDAVAFTYFILHVNILRLSSMTIL